MFCDIACISARIVRLKKRLSSFFPLIVFFSLVCCTSDLLVTGQTVQYSFTDAGYFALDNEVFSMHSVNNELFCFLDAKSQSLVYYDVTNVSACYELDHYQLDHINSLTLDRQRHLAYATSLSGIHIFNYSDPSQLELSACYSQYNESRTTIQVRENLLYIGNAMQGLHILDVTNPLDPILIGEWYDPVGYIDVISVLDNYVFACIRHFKFPGTFTPETLGVKVLDITDPSSISYVSTAITGGYYHEVAPQVLLDNVLYRSNWAEGVQLFDFTNPSDVELLGLYETEVRSMDVIDQETIFITDQEGLKVLDSSNPRQITLRSSYEKSYEWNCNDILHEGERTYIAMLHKGIRILRTEQNTIERTPGYTCLSISVIGIVSIIEICRRRR